MTANSEAPSRICFFNVLPLLFIALSACDRPVYITLFFSIMTIQLSLNPVKLTVVVMYVIIESINLSC